MSTAGVLGSSSGQTAAKVVTQCEPPVTFLSCWQAGGFACLTSGTAFDMGDAPTPISESLAQVIDSMEDRLETEKLAACLYRSKRRHPSASSVEEWPGTPRSNSSRP